MRSLLLPDGPTLCCAGRVDCLGRPRSAVPAGEGLCGSEVQCAPTISKLLQTGLWGVGHQQFSTTDWLLSLAKHCRVLQVSERER